MLADGDLGRARRLIEDARRTAERGDLTIDRIDALLDLALLTRRAALRRSRPRKRAHPRVNSTLATPAPTSARCPK
jgi:succinate dehydrogenase/fumarate reductase flavoprotein subunit